MISKCLIDLLQEILNHIARVDLVVNFKCPQEDLMKTKLGLRKFTSCQEHIFKTSSWTPTKQSQDEHVYKHAEEVTHYT
jgi:adenylate kinase